MITPEQYIRVLRGLVHSNEWATRIDHTVLENGVDQFSIFVGPRQQDVEGEADKVLAKETGK